MVIVSDGGSLKTQTDTHLTAFDYTLLPLMPNEKLLAAVEGDKKWLPFGSGQSLLECVNYYRLGCFCAPVSNALMVSADVCTPPVAASEQLSSGERIASHRSRSGSSAESDNRRFGCASISSMLMSGW